MIKKISPTEKKWHELANMVSRAKRDGSYTSLDATSQKTAKIALEKFAEKKSFQS